MTAGTAFPGRAMMSAAVPAGPGQRTARAGSVRRGGQPPAGGAARARAAIAGAAGRRRGGKGRIDRALARPLHGQSRRCGLRRAHRRAHRLPAASRAGRSGHGAFPGLVPTADQLAAERARPQAGKEGPRDRPGHLLQPGAALAAGGPAPARRHAPADAARAAAAARVHPDRAWPTWGPCGWSADGSVAWLTMCRG